MASMFQPQLFNQSKQVGITVSDDHDLVKLTELLNWTRLEALAEETRCTNGLQNFGKRPRYRPLLGAVALMAIKKMTYREAEDQIAHYAPARYLCGLMDSDMTLDHVTIFEFTQMLGPEGVDQLNRQILLEAQGHGLLDPTIVMSDTTAQEAKVPYPNEEGLMKHYLEIVSRSVGRLGGKFRKMRSRVVATLKKSKQTIRSSKLFGKTKEKRNAAAKKVYISVKKIQMELQQSLATGRRLSSKAGKKLEETVKLMDRLLPQIWYFLKTGFVAKNKILSLTIPEIYSIKRGKPGKKTEFGIKWGINRIGNGFLQGFLFSSSKNIADHKFCKEALAVHYEMFGQIPETYGFDRGGYSENNIDVAQNLGVKHVGIAPKGKTPWAVSDDMRDFIRRERAQVEGTIGTIKSSLYGFNKPKAKSRSAMEICGHRSILGFNMKKMVREWDLMIMEMAAT
jgi:hypothetical protein